MNGKDSKGRFAKGHSYGVRFGNGQKQVPSNGRTLCGDCHKNTETFGRWGKRKEADNAVQTL